MRVSSEPIAAVGDPPTSHANRDCSGEGPPEWQCQVGDQTAHRKRHPKNFALHTITVQPPLPAATWEAEVSKMNKTFGAAIPDENTQKIILYLQSHYTPDTRKQ
jgi:hypothetical protein